MINRFLYIALYHGNVFVLYNQGTGIQPVLRTTGQYLSDGMPHTIAVDFSYVNRYKLLFVSKTGNSLVVKYICGQSKSLEVMKRIHVMIS